MANKYLDDNGLLYFWQKIKTAFVAKESGKGLSTNDYTTAEKNKLSGIATGAEVNVIDTISVNNTALTPTNKAVNIEVPIATSDLTNDSNFVSDANYVHTDSNFTSAEKTKLAGIDTGAQVNAINAITRNGTALTPSSPGKVVDIAVPTKTSDLTNDSDFVTTADIPTKTSDLTNDSGFITSASVPTAYASNPAMNGTASAGSSTSWSRGDHVHPVDTSRAPLASPTFTGTPRSTTASKGTNTTQIATTAFVQTAIEDKVDAVAGKGLSTNDYTTAEKNKLAAFGDASTYALKTDITGMYKYKGSVEDYAHLPSTGQTTGDVYNTEDTGMNYAWDGTTWDNLGTIFTITSISNAEIDAIVAA